MSKLHSVLAKQLFTKRKHRLELGTIQTQSFVEGQNLKRGTRFPTIKDVTNNV
jgi:hypothetical protein